MSAERIDEFDLVILDIDGVLMLADGPAPGAVEALQLLRDHGRQVRILTNDAVSSRTERERELRDCGFRVQDGELFTACSLTASFLRERGFPRIQLLMTGTGRQEFDGLDLVDADAEVVVVGDFFDGYDRRALEAAYRAICDGAEFIAMQRNRHWWMGDIPRIDVGFWVAGLEFCTGRIAHVIGKPSPDAYILLARDAGCSTSRTVMVSDDAESDLQGARAAGLSTVHVRRGDADQSAPGTADLHVGGLIDWVRGCIDAGDPLSESR